MLEYPVPENGTILPQNFRRLADGRKDLLVLSTKVIIISPVIHIPLAMMLIITSY